MKMPIRVALAMLVSCSLIAASHAVTFDVFKASGTFTGFVTGVNDQSRAILIPFKLNTNQAHQSRPRSRAEGQGAGQ